MSHRHLALLLLLLPVQTAAQEAPIPLEYARNYFRELGELGRADGGKLWGVPVAGPLLFADRQTRTVVANMPDTAGVLRERDGVWVGTLPPEQNVANAALTWGGRTWAMVMWPVPDHRYVRRQLLMHESFHRIQPELGLPARDASNSHLSNADARIWLRLEWRALTEALLRTGRERVAALRDALAFRARRRSLYEAAAEDERLLELNEGLAEYTGLVLSGLPPAALYDRAAVQLTRAEQQEHYARNFAYASGPAYGVLLDAARKPWRARVTPASDLAEMARQAHGIGQPDTMDASALVPKYDGERMIAEERTREAQRLANEARLRERFISGPTLTLPVLDRFRYSFDPNGAVPLPDAGTVFESSRVTDVWGVLEVRAGGVLLRRDAGPITGVVVPVAGAATPPRSGDGWSLELEPGWTVRPGARAGDWIVAPESK